MDTKFSAMYEADIKGGRPSIAPEKLMRAMLLQVLYSIRSERQLVEQIQYNLLFRWFVGLAIEDAVWNHSVFSKNRDRLIEHDAVTGAVQRDGGDGRQARAAVGRALQRGRHADPGVGQPQERAAQGRLGRRRRPTARGLARRAAQQRHARVEDGPGVAAVPQEQRGAGTAELPGPCAHGQPPRPGGQRPGEPARRIRPNGTWPRRCWPTWPERQAHHGGRRQGLRHRGFVKACREINVTPHVAQNTNRSGGSAIDARTTRHAGYEISQRKRKCIEQCFGWGKLIGPMRQVMVQGLDKVDQLADADDGRLQPHAVAHLGGIAPKLRLMPAKGLQMRSCNASKRARQGSQTSLGPS